MILAGKGHGALWQVDETITTVTRVTSIPSVTAAHGTPRSRPPILFIHGVEFASATEALRDLVRPMLEIVGPNVSADRNIYIFTWNSLLTNEMHISEVLKGSIWRKINLIGRELPRCATYLRDVERRAKEAAQMLLPFAVEWNSDNKIGPTVITHSMGSLVWAETMMHLLASSPLLSKPGIWWSLQPAMPRGVFRPGGDYDMIPKVYSGRESARKLVWYSRWDHVLSTIYIASKKDFALGQRGCPDASIPQRDVTKWAREAHGMQHLSARFGHFFERVAVIMRRDARLLKI
jgi:hypothetical protein